MTDSIRTKTARRSSPGYPQGIRSRLAPASPLGNSVSAGQKTIHLSSSNNTSVWQPLVPLLAAGNDMPLNLRRLQSCTVRHTNLPIRQRFSRDHQYLRLCYGAFGMPLGVPTDSFTMNTSPRQFVPSVQVPAPDSEPSVPMISDDQA
jgi:hypothetical protein